MLKWFADQAEPEAQQPWSSQLCGSTTFLIHLFSSSCFRALGSSKQLLNGSWYLKKIRSAETAEMRIFLLLCLTVQGLFLSPLSFPSVARPWLGV